jgi:iron complex outermembrane recepter protein
MSELINTSDNPATIRWKLLTSASALALTATVSCSGLARAEDTDHPQIWIELGGQMEHVSGQGQVFDPAFIVANPDSPVLGPTTPLQAQRPATFSFGEDGKISFQPESSDWIFSAAIRYGRSSNTRHVDHQKSEVHFKYYNGNVPHGSPITVADFADTHASRSERHVVLDFTAGKDVGLGMFGSQSSSTLNFGVRFAQFTSKAAFDVRARPDLGEKYFTYGPYKFLLSHWHTYHATGHASREFHGVGPTLSWNGSAPFAGNPHDGELNIDWGINAAVLFGKQKARVSHHASGHYITPTNKFLNHGLISSYSALPHYDPPPSNRYGSRSVIVPNVGGSVGLSWRLQDFKVSLGYRADFFFGAMDTGIDAVKKSNLTFNGPYASISVGLGD